MDHCDDLEEQMDILQSVMRFVEAELRSIPNTQRRTSERHQMLLDDLYEVLERHGYYGLIKLVGDVGLHPTPQPNSEVKGWACDPEGDYYIFKR